MKLYDWLESGNARPHEGGFELSTFPSVNAWLERVRGQPGFVPITWRPA